MKKKTLALWTVIVSTLLGYGQAFATYIDNDGAVDLSGAVATLESNAYSVANQVFPYVIAIVVVYAIFKIFKRFAK